MSIPVTCSLCGTAFKVKEKYAGRTGRCPRCKTTLFVPEGNHPRDIPSHDATMASVPTAAATSQILQPSSGETGKQQLAKAIGFVVVALLSVAVLGLGVVRNDLNTSLRLVVQLGCFAALVAVVGHMFRNKCFVATFFTVAAWMIGLLVFTFSSASILTDSFLKSELLYIALMAGIVVTGMFGLLLPFIVGWIKAKSWDIRRLMWCWSLLILLNLILVSQNAGRRAAAQPSIARRSSVATPSNQSGLTVRQVANDNPDQAQPEQPPKTVTATDEHRIPQTSTVESGTDNSTTSPTETGLHVKLGNGVYVKNEDRFGLSNQYDVSVDFTFDPECTESVGRYFWVVDSPTGRSEMWLTDRGQGTLQGSLREFGIHRHLQQEKKNDGKWQCWVEIDTPGSPLFNHSRPRVSEVVTMRSADRLPPPKEYAPRPRREQIAEVPRRDTPQTSPPAQTQPRPPTPRPEVTLDETLAMLQENDKQRVKFALRWLRNNVVFESQHDEVAKRVAPLLKHPDGFVRNDAAKVMRLYATVEYVPQLIEALQDESFVVRNEVRDALSMFNDSRAAEAIVGLIDQDRMGAARALKNMGPIAEPAVIGLLQHPDQFTRGEAANILGEIGSRDSLQALKDMSDDPSFHARVTAEKAYRKIEFRLKQQQGNTPSTASKSV